MVLYIIKTFYFFRRRYSLSQSRMERRWFELVSMGNLVTTLAARFCYFWRLTTQTVPDARRGCSNKNAELKRNKFELQFRSI